MNLFRLLLAAGLALAGSARAADKADEKTAVEKSSPAPKSAPAADAAPKSREDALRQAGVKLVAGPATVPLGKVAELKLPEGYHFVGPDSLKRFYELTQNMPNGKEVGVLLAPGYMMFLDYDDVGYVKDEDKDKLDADKLLKAMSEGQDEANEERKSRGWDQLKLKGWATAPHYDEKTNNLKWAINLTTSHGNYAKVFINESIRLLGRAGVMNVTLAVGTEGFKAAEADAEKLLAANFAYVSGQKYSEFKAGDKVAAYGLSALVLGGGAVLAAKMGWLAALGAWFSKMWKAFVFVIVALGAALKQLWNKITGSRPTNPPDGTPPAA